MSIHDQVLAAAIRVCRGRGTWTFTPNEVVQLLPHLNAASVRTHVVSRCCLNAPRHHPNAWDYFKRVRRGTYEIQPKYRRKSSTRTVPKTVAEPSVAYRAGARPRRDTVHAVVVRDGAWYVAECLEIAVVTQARTLDEVTAALRDAVALHLEGEDLRALGVVRAPRLLVQYETSVDPGAAPA